MKLLIPIAIATLLAGSGCNKNEVSKPTNQCDTTNTMFSQLYNNVVASPDYRDDTTMDTRVHSYSFEVTSNKTICKIGYQNLGNLSTQPDRIQIYNNTTNSLLYSGTHYFSSSAISYVSITPVVLTVGNSYTISRTRDYITYVDELIGRVIVANNRNIISYPVVFGNLTITASYFGQAGTDPGVVGIPYIDLVFE